MSVDKPIAFGLAGAAIFEVAKLYHSSVPSLHDIGASSPDDDTTWAALIHADLFVGGVALIAGAWLAYALHSVLPLGLIVLVFVFTSVLHHRVLDTTP